MKFFLPLLLSSILSISATAQTAVTDTTGSMKVSTKDTGRNRMVSIGPALMNFALDKGQNKSQTLYFVNRKSTKQIFNLTIKDFTFDVNNKTVITDANSHDFSCADWISLDKNYIEVAPHTTEKVRITLSVPDDPEAIKKMRWALVEATAVADAMEGQYAKDKVKISVNPKPGVGVQIYQRPPNAMKDIKMVSFEKKQDTCRILANNIGLTSLECKVSVELSGVDNDVKETVSKQGLNILPGTKRYVDLMLPSTLPKGKYNAIAIIDAGDDDVPLEASQSIIEIN